MNTKSHGRLLAVFALAALLVSGALFAPAAAQPQVKKAVFDGQAAFNYIKVMASDAMFGRKSGEPGGIMVEDYVSSTLKGWGLEPAGTGGGWFQDMTYEYFNVEPGASLELITGAKKREFVYEEDWQVANYSGSGTLAANIVFAGYGISAPQKDYDEYAGVDVKGKLVLFSTGTPQRFGDKLKDEAQFQARVKAAQEHGAAGVLTFRPDTMGAMVYYGRGGGLKKDIYKPDFVIVSLDPRVMNFLFKHIPTETRYLFQQIEATGKPQSFDTKARALLNLKTVFDEKRACRNVLAKITGTDNAAKNEYVMLGAHMDHLGVDMTGDVFNGADDNASGTAVVMETARVMKLNRLRPRRTIVFALWAAEEEGLLGSKYYTEHPIYPLDKTVAYINLDMEGHGTGKVAFRGVYYAPEIWDLLKVRLPKELVDNALPGRGGPGGSDHTYFLAQGVPGYFVATDGFHFRTNRVGDVIELIKPDILKKAGDFVGAAVEVLATEPKVPFVTDRRALYYWRYENVTNLETAGIDQVVAEHKDVVDPDVDFQLAAAGAKEGLSGDALRVDLMRNLLAGIDKVRASKGLAAYERQATMSPMMMMGMRGGPAKTTVLSGLKGVDAFRDDPAWAGVFAKQGAAFVMLDGPTGLFNGDALSDDGKKAVETVGKANMLLIAKGLAPGQVKALLAAAKKPVLVETEIAPGEDIIALVKKTNSAIGLVMGKIEGAPDYFKRLDALRKAAGNDSVTWVSANNLWSQAGKEQTMALIGEMLKAKYENEDLAACFSGTFQRVLAAALAQ